MPPTGTPVPEQVFQSLEAALGAIVEGSDYYWTIRQVLRFNAGYPDVTEYPSAVLLPLGTEIDDALTTQSTSYNVERLQAQIDVWFDKSDDVPETLMEAAADVRKALMTDPQRGGIALHTRILRNTPFFSENAAQPLSVIEVGVEVIYRTNVADLTVSV